MDNLETINKFLETNNFTKIKLRIHNINRPITSKEKESVSKNQQEQQKKTQDQMAASVKSTKYLKKNMNPSSTAPQKIKGGTLPNPFYEVSTTLTQKAENIL